MKRRSFFSFLSGLAVALFGWPLASHANTESLYDFLEHGEYRGASWRIYYFVNYKELCYDFKIRGERYGQHFILSDVPWNRDYERKLVEVLKLSMKRGVDQTYEKGPPPWT